MQEWQILKSGISKTNIFDLECNETITKNNSSQQQQQQQQQQPQQQQQQQTRQQPQNQKHP